MISIIIPDWWQDRNTNIICKNTNSLCFTPKYCKPTVFPFSKALKDFSKVTLQTRSRTEMETQAHRLPGPRSFLPLIAAYRIDTTMISPQVLPGRLFLENRLRELNLDLWNGNHQERRWGRAFQAEGPTDATHIRNCSIASPEHIKNILLIFHSLIHPFL